MGERKARRRRRSFLSPTAQKDVSERGDDVIYPLSYCTITQNK